MKFILFLSIILFGASYVFAATIEAEYDIFYGDLVKMGRAKSSLVHDGATYKIKMVANSEGFSRFLSAGRDEEYESVGVVQDGKFLPNVFVKKRKNIYKEEIKTYLFDHKNKKITEHKVKIQNNQEEKYEEILEYYANNDILTLYFNVADLIKKEDEMVLYAVGANKKDGKVDIQKPKNFKLEEMKNLLGTNEGLFLNVILNQKIFASQKGELSINIKDGICDRATLKDVLFFGDIEGKLINKKVSQ